MKPIQVGYGYLTGAIYAGHVNAKGKWTEKQDVTSAVFAALMHKMENGNTTIDIENEDGKFTLKLEKQETVEHAADAA